MTESPAGQTPDPTEDRPALRTGDPHPDASAHPRAAADSDQEGAEETETLRPALPAHRELTVGFVPGVMPAKWFDRWRERFGSRVPLRTLPLEPDTGLDALASEHAHMVLLRPEREPEALDRDRFHAVRLYEEVPVLVMPADHVLSLLEEVPVEEIAEEFLLQDPAEVPEWAALQALRAEGQEPDRTRKLPATRHLGDAVELVAAGLGLLVLPKSLARFHRRKDVVHRPLTGVAGTEVLLVWPRLLPGTRPEEDEAILQEFVGVTRGRRPDSSRGTGGTTSSGRRATDQGVTTTGTKARGTRIQGAKDKGSKAQGGRARSVKPGNPRAGTRTTGSGRSARRGSGRAGSRGRR